MPDPALPIPESYWVVPGRLLAGEYPGAREPQDARPKLRSFLAAGMTYFIDLTVEGELAPYAALLGEEAAALGYTVVHERLPICDQGVPTPAVMTKILDSMDAALAQWHTVYVHCWGGHGRTGTVVGCFLVRQGLTGEQALAEVARLHATTPDRARPSPDTDEQRALVRTWPAHDGANASASGATGDDLGFTS
jgi:hypothetical protein